MCLILPVSLGSKWDQGWIIKNIKPLYFEGLSLEALHFILICKLYSP